MKRNYTDQDAQNRETTLRQTEATDAGRTRSFGYDSLDRLVRAIERNSSTQAVVHPASCGVSIGLDALDR